ncbi:MAG: hypothetical protein WCT24_02835 [Patescibacteria group bacterium]
MNSEQLARLMALARKTGAPLIVTDPEGHEPMVLLGIDLYEELILDHPCECWDGEELPLEDIPLEEIPEDFLETRVEPASEKIVLEPEKIVPDVKEQKNQENGDLPLSEEQFYLEPIES